MNPRKLLSEKLFDLGNLLVAGSSLGMVFGEWIRISWMIFLGSMGVFLCYLSYTQARRNEEEND